MLSAVVALPPLIFVIWIGPPLYFSILVSVAAGRGAWEFFRIARVPGKPVAWIMGSVLAAGITFGGHLEPYLLPYLVLWTTLLLFFSSALWLPANTWPGPRGLAGGVIGTLFVGATLGSLTLLRNFGGEPEGWQWTFYLLLVIWGSDTGAYYVGRSFGKHPLSPRLSPNKTIEGAIAGLATGVVGGILSWSWFLPPKTSLWETCGVSLLLAITGIIGDLAESAMKRTGGTKDSGGIIPGHGGILDRLDSLMFTGPILYMYLVWTTT